MLSAPEFVRRASEAGLDFYTGVPCSFLTPLINRVISDRSLRYVGAASEGEAIGIASGAWLAGRLPVVMCQNSGLGNTVNPITSLSHTLRIPLLLITTWRGEPGIADEPQHDVMGAITPQLLETMRVPHAVMAPDATELSRQLATATAAMHDSRLPYAFIMRKDTIAPEALDGEPILPGRQPPVEDRLTHVRSTARIEALAAILDSVPDTAAIVATTGKCARELFTLGDRVQNLYVVGSMGCASAVGLGIALNVERPIVVLDGDGAALMKLGTLATIGAYAPKQLIHIILDNGVHDSTGGQETVSASVDFALVAAACGYGTASRCDDVGGLRQAVATALARPGPHLIHMRITPGSIDKLGRPTVSPQEVAARFRDFLLGGAAAVQAEQPRAVPKATAIEAVN